MPLRRVAILLLPLLCAHAAVPKELQAIADQARALPPEFSADILLRLVASPLATDVKWKRGLIEDAFQIAAHGQSPYRRQGSVWYAHVEIVRLDALTLQTRAVEAMLRLDPQRAVTMFQDVPSLVLPKLSCQEALTPDVSPYYQTATALFASAFTAAQRYKEQDGAFLREHLAAVHSPSQVVPALKMLNQVELAPQVRTELTAILAVALDRIDGGNREFAASESLLVGAAVPEMHESVLLPALRAYIVRHVSGPRCSDQIKTGQLPESATQFNKLISRVDPQGIKFHAITDKEAEPLKDDGGYPASIAEQSPAAKQAMAVSAALRVEDRSNTEWTAHYFEALKLIEGWRTGEAASPDNDSLMLAAQFSSLVDMAPDGPSRRTGLASFLRFLERQYGSMESRRYWFMEFQMLLSVARTANASQGRPFADRDQAWVLDQLVHSSNSVISVYAQMESLLGAS